MRGEITVENVSKFYRLYHKPGDRLREVFHPLRRKYHQLFKALDDVSFHLASGATLGIIGRNGSGKSTLLKLVAGILTPNSGRISTQGRVAALLELGAGFNPELSGLENVYFQGTLMGYSRREMAARLPAIADFAEIGPYLDQPIKTYSSGMFVRLAFAVAINVDPDILIIDEALAVGDINFQARCFQKIAEFKNAGRTIVFVSHALDTVLRYCDQVLVLDEGRKITQADPKTAVDCYKQLMAEHDHRQAAAVAPHVAAAPDIPEKARRCFRINPDVLSYGNHAAVIADFGILDENGRPAQLLINTAPCTIYLEVVFNTRLENPVFAYTVKDLKGLEITGANTLFQGMATGVYQPGARVRVEFKQRLALRPGHYALSLGCTGPQDDKLLIFHRLYDVLLFEVAAPQPVVGLFDPAAEITVARL